MSWCTIRTLLTTHFKNNFNLSYKYPSCRHVLLLLIIKRSFANSYIRTQWHTWEDRRLGRSSSALYWVTVSFVLIRHRGFTVDSNPRQVCYVLAFSLPEGIQSSWTQNTKTNTTPKLVVLLQRNRWQYLCIMRSLIINFIVAPGPGTHTRTHEWALGSYSVQNHH